MRSAAFSVNPKTAHTAMMIIAVLLFTASHASGQQRKTIRKENTATNAKGGQSQATVTTWVKAELTAITLSKQPISVQLVSDSLISISLFQPASDPIGGFICTMPGLMIIQQDPWKPLYPSSILDFF